jgi:uncharacterized repeat protein (TIGR03803 family)
MNPRQRLRNAGRSAAIVLTTVALASVASADSKEKVLYSFQGGSDGQFPAGGVVFDKAGNLYGATYEGGSTCSSPGCGTIFQLSPGSGGTWTETILYGFNGNQGSRPEGGVIADKSGNLYGTTAYGGSGTCILLGGNVGCGVVYELSPPAQEGGQWTYTVLYNFRGGKDGQIPHGDLTLDDAGNLYGATLYGGGHGSCNAPYFQHCGTVFKLSTPKQKGGKWTEEVLHSFKSGTDGANPNGGLLLGCKGVIYGTTFAGGTQNCAYQGYVGCGTAFRLTPPSGNRGDWSEKQLHVFSGKNGGANPAGELVFDAEGSLFGIAQAGGYNNEGDGVAFRLTSVDGAEWKETVLHVFSSNNRGGATPLAGLLFDTQGDLYGTASWSHVSDGDVFRIEPPSREGGDWTLRALYGFAGPPDGATPGAGLVLDKRGNLYSTTQMGGTGQVCQGGCGIVFEVSP